MSFGITASLVSRSASQTSGSAPQAFSGNLPWHLGSAGIDAAAVWSDYTGNGVKVGVFDDGIQSNHGGLRISSTSSTSSASSGYGLHGTAVSGLIGASGSNAVGVAYGATISNVDVIGLSSTNLAAAMANASNFDVVNNSWSWTSAYAVNTDAVVWNNFARNIANATDNGRGGLGTVVVAAAGNTRQDNLDTNLSGFANDRHVVTVAAVTSEGHVAAYSNPGASILVGASSGGGSRAGLTTTDLTGSAGYVSGDYLTDFTGTSAAAPLVSGTIALMLEANANLGWRDVRSILAMSANPISGAGTENAASNWNGSGMIFSNDVGYGVIDARAAVRLAETWLGTNTSHNELSFASSAAGLQTLTDSGAITYQITIASGLSVENAVLRLEGSHERSADLQIDLISPNGTVSHILANVGGEASFRDFTFSSNAFLGEQSAGVWTVQIRDTVGGSSGSFTSASLALYGEAQSEDGVYVYTDAFSTLGGSARSTLIDHNGIDVLNASAVTTSSSINLTPGATSIIAGRSVTIDQSTTIEVAFGGDGNDVIVGNAAANLIHGGRGNDALYGGAGNDILVGGAGIDKFDGGQGTDVVRLDGRSSGWNVSHSAGQLSFSNASTGEVESAVNVEALLFDNGILAFDAQSEIGSVFRLYEGAFGRAPDLNGLMYWLDGMSNGVHNVHSIAALFTTSAEFGSIYGNTPSTELFLASLYQHTLGREASAAEIHDWMQFGAASMSRGQLLTSFTESAEAISITGTTFNQGVFIAGEVI